MTRCATWFLTSIVFLTACSPSLNWREVQLDMSGMKALLPCKPDRGSRRQSLAGEDVEMHMLGCEAEGAIFAVSFVEFGSAPALQVAQAQWQANMAHNVQAVHPNIEHVSLKVSGAPLEALKLRATGRRPDGSPVEAEAVWFSRGVRLYHAVIYAERIGDEIREPFFSGLEFQ